MNAVKKTHNTTFEALKGELNLSNVMQTPKVVKVLVTSGVGSVKDKKRQELILDRLASITGQAPAKRTSKKSIASFKVREGDLAGYQVTLRGAHMRAFLDKLVHIVFPRIKDFRGLKVSAIDDMGNYSIGIKEHTVFPEAADEDSRDIFGLGITIVTTAKDKKQAEALLRHIGIPLQA